MVQLIYGKKGSGKTKRLIDMVNAEVQQTNGDVIFIDDNKRYMYDVKHQVRFVDVSEYKVDNEDKLYGFLCGMLAQNFDIAAIYLDAFVHIVGKQPEELEEYFGKLVKLAEKNEIKMVFNISGDPDNVPAYLKDFVI
ncbi:MAG: hypothetical protein IJP03_02100 [Christensenellaceae bacterium]|nr:hypothetical protein [Christensenellaceae bacterium]